VTKSSRNFGGDNHELWCDGGELLFITRIIKEGKAFSKQCGWFTSLVSKEENLKAIYRELKLVKAAEYGIIEMKQGTKNSRLIAWRY